MKKYNIIYADPPWKYDDQLGKNPRWGGITYPVMTHSELCALPVRKIAEKDCILFLWATMPMLPKALEVMNFWGFNYRTCAFVWVKQNPKSDGIYTGLGKWTNSNAELCLLGRQGHVKRVRTDVKQIVIAHRREHSRKPDEVRDRIVQLMGDLPRIELFAREKTEGWDVWGNEVESETEL